jgi:hypothetical protein
MQDPQDRFLDDRLSANPFSPLTSGSTFFVSGRRPHVPNSPYGVSRKEAIPFSARQQYAAPLPSWIRDKPGKSSVPLPPALCRTSPAPYTPSPSHLTPPFRTPFGQSSTVVVHSGFWQLLAATGSRFLVPDQPVAAPPTVRSPVPMPTGGYQRSRQRKRVTADMVGRPRDFR